MNIKLYLVLLYLITNYYLCKPILTEKMDSNTLSETDIEIPQIKVKDNDFMTWIVYLIIFNIASFGFIVIILWFRKIRPIAAPKL